MRQVAPAFYALGHGVLLQLSPALFDLFMQRLCCSVLLESCHSLCHQPLTNAQRGPSGILGAYQCSDLEPTQIWWVFGSLGPWDSAYLISCQSYLLECDYPSCWRSLPHALGSCSYYFSQVNILFCKVRN